MSIAPYLKTIGRGKDGARALSSPQAQDLMGQILDGRVSDLELGGFALAMRIKGETPDELLGFLAAAQAHTLPLSCDSPAVVLPSYNGARKLPNFTPLLACALARAGVPVLVHGGLTDPGRVTSAEIFTALDQPPVTTAGAVQERWTQSQPAFMPLASLNRPLAGLLALRGVLGLRNSGHTLAKLLPALPGALRVVNYTHPEYAVSLSAFLALSGADALLLRGTEGEPVVDCRRQPQATLLLAGQAIDDLSLAAQEGVLTTLPALPATHSAQDTAEHIRAVLDGTQAMPAPIQRQIDTLLAARARLMARSH